jgi:hypothetical protein
MKVGCNQNSVDTLSLEAGKKLVSSKATRRDDERPGLAKPRQDLALPSRITKSHRQAKRREFDLGVIKVRDPVHSV